MELHEQQRPSVTGSRPAPSRATPHPGFYAEHGKRLLDLAVATAVLIVAAPVMAAIALAIKLDSRGPIIFAQDRVGKDGALFHVFKFRTMQLANDESIHAEYVRRLITQNAAPAPGASLKLQHDPRVTRVGRLLRRSSLDELPQFVNVLLGEMSVVGPRPDVPYAVAAYPPAWHARFAVLPGITGLWQVEARNRVSYEQMIQLDLDYCRRQSLALDLRLMVRTPLVMLTGSGAG